MLKVGGDVLVGLKRWETFVPEVDMLLNCMPGVLGAALHSARLSIGGTCDLPQSFSPTQVHIALGFQHTIREPSDSFLVMYGQGAKVREEVSFSDSFLYSSTRVARRVTNFAFGAKFDLSTDLHVVKSR